MLDEAEALFVKPTAPPHGGLGLMWLVGIRTGPYVGQYRGVEGLGKGRLHGDTKQI